MGRPGLTLQCTGPKLEHVVSQKYSRSTTCVQVIWETRLHLAQAFAGNVANDDAQSSRVVPSMIS